MPERKAEMFICQRWSRAEDRDCGTKREIVVASRRGKTELLENARYAAPFAPAWHSDRHAPLIRVSITPSPVPTTKKKDSMRSGSAQLGMDEKYDNSHHYDSFPRFRARDQALFPLISRASEETAPPDTGKAEGSRSCTLGRGERWSPSSLEQLARRRNRDSCLPTQ